MLAGEAAVEVSAAVLVGGGRVGQGRWEGATTSMFARLCQTILCQTLSGGAVGGERPVDTGRWMESGGADDGGELRFTISQKRSFPELPTYVAISW